MPDDKKIIVDEDWKSQVAAEREALAQQQAAAPGDSGPAAASGADPAERPALPPGSFEGLVTTLAVEAMIGLGQVPHPVTQQLHRDVAQARYAIDILEMLAEKTAGNLTAEEDRGLQALLHQLRMAYLAVSTPG
ncbi:MAG TPA: DUF1844 domain-containing protein [Lacipirellulaceae bacterium]|nr:DUF1844 domain-containing protein [Lacipirellulaceae bacterium]